MDWRVDRSAIAALGLPDFGGDRQEIVTASMIAELGLAAETDAPWLSYSRSRDWYAAGHFEGTQASYLTVTRAVGMLLDEGLIEEERARKGDHLRTGRQSRIRATDEMVARLAGHRFKHAPGRTLVMRDADGNPMPMPRTERTRRMQRDVDELNEWLASMDVTISAAAAAEDWQRTGHHLKARKVKDGKETWATVLPNPGNQVIRILGRGRYDCHGRLYGWWQGLPKARRAELLINGELLIEPDFECLHPTLLYASKGIRLDFDPYVTGLYSRQHGKWALNVLINAASTKAAVDALMWKPGWNETRCYTELLVDEIAQRNASIREYLGSDAGVILMGYDSAMALDVLKRCRKAGVSGVLPVHDSFLAPARSGNRITAIMQDVLDATRVRISGSSSIASPKSIRQIVTFGAEPLAGSPGAEPLPEIPPAETVPVSLPDWEPWPASCGDTPGGALPAPLVAELPPASRIPEGLASLLEDAPRSELPVASLWAKPIAASLEPPPASSASLEDACTPLAGTAVSRPSWSRLDRLRKPHPDLAPVEIHEEQGPGFEPNARKRAEGMTVRLYSDSVWLCIGMRPVIPEEHEPEPERPVRRLRDPPRCAPFPSRSYPSCI